MMTSLRKPSPAPQQIIAFSFPICDLALFIFASIFIFIFILNRFFRKLHL